MLDARERAPSFRDSRRFGPSETRRRHGRKDVFDVVRARQRNLLDTQYGLFFAVMAKDNFVFPHEGTLGHALFPAKPVHVRFHRRQGRGRRIIRVQHRAVAFRLVLEDARFGVAILFEPVIPIKRPSRKRSASSTSLQMVTPLARAACSKGASAGTPGLGIIRSCSKNEFSRWPPSSKLTPSVRIGAIASPISFSARASVAVTFAPR